MRGLVINIIIDRFGGWLDFLMPVGIRVFGAEVGGVSKFLLALAFLS